MRRAIRTQVLSIERKRVHPANGHATEGKEHILVPRRDGRRDLEIFITLAMKNLRVTRCTTVRFTQGFVLLFDMLTLKRCISITASMPPSARFPRRGPKLQALSGRRSGPNGSSRSRKLGEAKKAPKRLYQQSNRFAWKSLYFAYGSDFACIEATM